MLLCPPQIPHRVAWDWIQTFDVTGRRPTVSNTEMYLNCLPKHEHSDRCFTEVYAQSTCSTAKCLLYVLQGLKSSHSANTVYVSILQEVVVVSTYSIWQLCSLEATYWTAIHNDNQFRSSSQQMDMEMLPAKLNSRRLGGVCSIDGGFGSNLRSGGLLFWGFNADTESRQENDAICLKSDQNRLLSCASQLTITLTFDAIRL
jgi:hypothetical protein